MIKTSKYTQIDTRTIDKEDKECGGRDIHTLSHTHSVCEQDTG